MCQSSIVWHACLWICYSTKLCEVLSIGWWGFDFLSLIPPFILFSLFLFLLLILHILRFSIGIFQWKKSYLRHDQALNVDTSRTGFTTLWETSPFPRPNPSWLYFTYFNHYIFWLIHLCVTHGHQSKILSKRNVHTCASWGNKQIPEKRTHTHRHFRKRYLMVPCEWLAIIYKPYKRDYSNKCQCKSSWPLDVIARLKIPRSPPCRRRNLLTHIGSEWNQVREKSKKLTEAARKTKKRERKWEQGVIGCIKKEI